MSQSFHIWLNDLSRKKHNFQRSVAAANCLKLHTSGARRLGLQQAERLESTGHHSLHATDSGVSETKTLVHVITPNKHWLTMSALRRQQNPRHSFCQQVQHYSKTAGYRS